MESISLFSSEDFDVREQAVWALGNIAGEGAAMRDLVLECGGMKALVDLVNGDLEMVVRRRGKLNVV